MKGWQNAPIFPSHVLQRHGLGHCWTGLSGKGETAFWPWTADWLGEGGGRQEKGMEKVGQEKGWSERGRKGLMMGPRAGKWHLS